MFKCILFYFYYIFIFLYFYFFFFNDTATTEIYTLSLHDALPISLNMQRILDIWTDSTNPYNKESKHGTGYSERSIDGCPIPTLVDPYYEWTSGNMCIEFEKFEPTYTLVIVANSPNMRQDYCIPRPYNPFKYSTAHQPNTAEFDNLTTTTHAIKSNRLCPQGRIV